MLTYWADKSPGEWAKMDAPLADVVEKDQQIVIDAYTKASEELIASKLEIKFKNVKTGKIIKSGSVKGFNYVRRPRFRHTLLRLRYCFIGSSFPSQKCFDKVVL